MSVPNGMQYEKADPSGSARTHQLSLCWESYKSKIAALHRGVILQEGGTEQHKAPGTPLGMLLNHILRLKCGVFPLSGIAL